MLRSVVIAFAMTTALAAQASDLEDLALAGYAVWMKTQVNGEFQGCEYGKQIELLNGLVFICSTYKYHYAYMPRVLILQNLQTRDIKVIIDDDEMSGNVFQR